MFRTIQTGGWLAGAAFLLLTAPASAQLEPTTWTESVTLRLDNTTQNWTGDDPASPEPLTEELVGPKGHVNGTVSYGPAGPPEILVSEEESCQMYTPASGSSSGVVTFSFRVVQTSSPPVDVSYIPILVTVLGSVNASGGGDNIFANHASARVSFSLTRSEAEIINEQVSTTNGPAAIDFSKTFSALLDGVFIGRMQCAAGVSKGLLDPKYKATADANIHPEISLTSAFIPGTESKYADYFAIEFSPGYWALGDPTPVNPTTWGRIKSLYSDGR